jgi:hypothetical protein
MTPAVLRDHELVLRRERERAIVQAVALLLLIVICAVLAASDTW